MRFGVRLLVVAAALLTAAEGRAQNLLTNPHFDFDDSGWGAGSFGSHLWVGSPDHGAPGSTNPGAMQITSPTPTFGNASLFQCVPATESVSYGFGVWVWLDAGQIATCPAYQARTVVNWYSSPTCASGLLGTVFGANASAGTTGAWQKLTDAATAPSGTQAVAYLLISACGTTGQTHWAYYDDAFIGAGLTPAHLTRFGAE